MKRYEAFHMWYNEVGKTLVDISNIMTDDKKEYTKLSRIDIDRRIDTPILIVSHLNNCMDLPFLQKIEEKQEKLCKLFEYLHKLTEGKNLIYENKFYVFVEKNSRNNIYIKFDYRSFYMVLYIEETPPLDTYKRTIPEFVDYIREKQKYVRERINWLNEEIEDYLDWDKEATKNTTKKIRQVKV